MMEQENATYHNPYEHELRLAYQGALVVAQTPALVQKMAMIVVFQNERSLQNAVASFQSRMPYKLHELDPAAFGGFPAFVLPLAVDMPKKETGETTPMMPWDGRYLLHQVKLARLPLIETASVESLIPLAAQHAQSLTNKKLTAFDMSSN